VGTTSHGRMGNSALTSNIAKARPKGKFASTNLSIRQLHRNAWPPVPKTI